jgi:ABC-type branched-subunit amino acid transport system ATPase component
MFERLVKNLIADLAPKLIPQLLRSIADQIECGQISFSQEAITELMESQAAREAIAQCMPESE